MIFEYSAKNSSGEDKQGKIEAQNQSEVVARLQEQGLIIISLNQIGVKKCPFCAEEIKEEAIICRFCGYDLKTGKPKEMQARSSVQDGVNIGCGMFIMLPLIIIGAGLLFLAVAGSLSSVAVDTGWWFIAPIALIFIIVVVALEAKRKKK